MNAPAETSPPQSGLPGLLRRAAGHLPDGPHRSALDQLADELEGGGDPAPISHATIWAALKAFGSPEHRPNADFHFRTGGTAPPEDEVPPHLRRVAFLRREADHHPDGHARDALLRYADELEEKGDSQLVAPKIMHAALKAFNSPDRLPDDDHPICTCNASPPEDEVPRHLRRVAFLRREADHHPDGPARDALLRYADELEEKGDSQLVSDTTLRAALRAFGSPDRLPDIDGAVAL